MKHISIPIPVELFGEIYKRFGADAGDTIIRSLRELLNDDKPNVGIQSSQAQQFVRPKPGTITGRVWEIADQLYANSGEMNREAVVTVCMNEGIKMNTASTQYSHWKNSHNQGQFQNTLLEALSGGEDMDNLIEKLQSPDACDRFAKNAEDHGQPELARAAIQRAVELKAKKYGAQTQAEKECLEAIYAYERILTARNDRTTRATRTWQMIERRGIIPSVDRLVSKPQETVGYAALHEMGLDRYAFEAVVLRYPDLFSDKAIEQSRARLEQWQVEAGASKL